MRSIFNLESGKVINRFLKVNFSKGDIVEINDSNYKIDKVTYNIDNDTIYYFLIKDELS